MKRLLILIALVSISACGSNPTSPSASVSVPFSSTDLTAGTGTTAVAGRTVSVNYTGWLYDATKTDNKGTQFDSSVGRGRSRFCSATGT